MSQFIAGTYASEIFEPTTGPVFPTIGAIEYGPGNVSTYSLKVTYNYHNYLPESSTWAMMLLGFGAYVRPRRSQSATKGSVP